MKTLFFTREFPPYVYGGAGVHVEYLAKELAQLMEVDVRCFGDQDLSDENTTVKGYSYGEEKFEFSNPLLKPVLQTLHRNRGFLSPFAGGFRSMKVPEVVGAAVEVLAQLSAMTLEAATWLGDL